MIDTRRNTGPTVGALACTVLLALLWVLRPPLPQIESFTASMSDIAFEELIMLIAWVLLTLAILRLDYEALQTLSERCQLPRRLVLVRDHARRSGSISSR